MCRLRRAQPRAGGFTLIELMIVVAISGVLVAIAISRYERYAEKARSTETAFRLGKWADELDIWARINGRFPDDSHIVLPPEAARTALISIEADKIPPAPLSPLTLVHHHEC